MEEKKSVQEGEAQEEELREQQEDSPVTEPSQEEAQEPMTAEEETAAEDKKEEEKEEAQDAAGQEEEKPAEEEAAPQKKEEGASRPWKKEKKHKKPDPKDEQIASLQDRLLRNMAEFDNYRKREEKQQEVIREMGARSVIERLLPILDNFERGFGLLTEEEKCTPFAQGMEKVYKQLLTGLQDSGLKAIEAVGAPFDPHLHNAVMHVEDEAYGENVVVEELQKGYYYKDSVIRYSMVKVAN